MSFISDIMNNNYWWMPIVAIIFICGIGILIGAINGWKTALYFFGWNIVAFVSTVLIVDAVFKDFFNTWIWKNLPSSLTDKLKDAIDNTREVLRPIILIMLGMGIAIISNIFAAFIYIFVRKHLKKTILVNKAAGKSNITTRVIGAGLGFLTALPVAIPLAAVSAGFSKNANVNKMTDGLAKMITFGKADHVSQDIKSLYSLADLATANDMISNLTKIFQATNVADISVADIEDIKGKVEVINHVLEDPKAFDLVTTMVKSQVKDAGSVTLDASAFTSNPSNTKFKGLLSGITNTDKVKTLIKSVVGTGTASTEIDALLAFLKGA